MTSRPGRPIVVGVDASPSSNDAVAWAARDAELRGAPLRLVHVVPPIVMPAGPWRDATIPASYAMYAERRAQQTVDDAYAVAMSATSPERADQVATAVLDGPVVPTLIGLSRNAEMVVVGCLGESTLSRVLLGSISTGVVHHAHCPVAVIHNERRPSPDAPVVVGIDGSPASEAATAIAFDESSRRGVALVAVHAWTDMGPLDFPSINWSPIEWANIKVEEEEVLAERLAGWRDRYPDVTVRSVVVSDRPAPRLLEQADAAQLIVVGSHGRGGFEGMLLGSVSTAIVHSAEVPVIVARR
ncbi:MAG: universal stress protein [Actinomycetota bacterium]